MEFVQQFQTLIAAIVALIAAMLAASAAIYSSHRDRRHEIDMRRQDEERRRESYLMILEGDLSRVSQSILVIVTSYSQPQQEGAADQLIALKEHLPKASDTMTAEWVDLALAPPGISVVVRKIAESLERVNLAVERTMLEKSMNNVKYLDEKSDYILKMILEDLTFSKYYCDLSVEHIKKGEDLPKIDLVEIVKTFNEMMKPDPNLFNFG